MSDVRIEGERVALRPLAEEDLAAVEPWYAEAVAAVEGIAQLLSIQVLPGCATVGRCPSAGMRPVARNC